MATQIISYFLNFEKRREIFSANGQKMEGFQGRKFFAREPRVKPRRKAAGRSGWNFQKFLIK